jgi:M6 family metalloprotease-like protein
MTIAARIIRILSLALLAALIGATARAARLDKVPITETLPDGRTVILYASGDEYFHRLHDESDYTIIREAGTGRLVYAVNRDGALVSSGLAVGSADPRGSGIPPHALPAPEFRPSVPDFLQLNWDNEKTGVEKAAPVTGVRHNVVVFIRFSDQAEFTQTIAQVEPMFNSTAAGASSMINYFREASYDQLTINSSFYPLPGATLLSYQDSHPRSYYLPYDEATNPDGYQDIEGQPGQGGARMALLMKNAIEAVRGQIPAGLDIDGNDDGKVDNVCLYFRGSVDAWGHVLWPYRSSQHMYDIMIGDKLVRDFNTQFENAVYTGVLCHEMFHTLGAPDLYHYAEESLGDPVGFWDLESSQGWVPQHMTAQMKWKYVGWISEIPEATSSGWYELSPLADGPNCLRVESPDSDEYWVLEYRRKTGTFESSVPASALLVYRVNRTLWGNADGPPDEIYIYRPGGTPDDAYAGSPSNGGLSGSGRQQLNDDTNPSPFLTDGTPGHLNISQVSVPGDTIRFYLTVPNELAPPSSLSANALSAFEIELTWRDNSVGETLYRIETAPSTHGPWTLAALAALNSTRSVIDDLAPDTLYYFRVCACKGSDVLGGWSNIAAARTPLNPPAAPTGLTATVVSDFRIDLAWTDHATDEEWYLVERRRSDEIDWSILKWLYPDTTSYSNIGLTSGYTYYYRVKALNAGGSSAYSNTASAAIGVPPSGPAAPANLTATAVSSSAIRLTWDDMSGNESMFQVYHQCCGLPVFAPIATLNPNTETFLHSGLDPNEEHSYFVRAVNFLGNNSSNSASTTTRSAPSHPRVLVIDADGDTEFSGEARTILHTINDCGQSAASSIGFPAEIAPDLNSLVFVWLGDSGRLTEADALKLKSYIDNGGRGVYLEGPVAWRQYYTGNGWTSFHPYFGIRSTEHDYQGGNPLSGQITRFTERLTWPEEWFGLELDYLEIDSAAPDAFAIWHLINPSICCGIARDTGDWRTIGMSVPFRVIPAAYRLYVMARYLAFLTGSTENVFTPRSFGVHSVQPGQVSLSWQRPLFGDSLGTVVERRVYRTHQPPESNWQVIGVAVSPDLTLLDNRAYSGVYEYRARNFAAAGVSAYTDIATADLGSTLIQVRSPYANQQFQIGERLYVEWDAFSLAGDVTISLTKGGVTVRTLATAPAASSYIQWRIPGDVAPGEDYLVKVSQGAVWAMNEGYFTIGPAVVDGDVCWDENLDPNDLIGAMLYLAGAIPGTGWPCERPEKGDFNDNGVLDAEDLLLLAHRLAGNW